MSKFTGRQFFLVERLLRESRDSPVSCSLKLDPVIHVRQRLGRSEHRTCQVLGQPRSTHYTALSRGLDITDFRSLFLLRLDWL